MDITTPIPSDVPVSMTYMVIETKCKQNIGTVVRCAVAFGIDTLVVIGSHKFGTHGAHGSQKFIRVMHFFYWVRLNLRFLIFEQEY
jgi:coenzyme F420-reducing hydrogenase delta subunit